MNLFFSVLLGLVAQYLPSGSQEPAKPDEALNARLIDLYKRDAAEYETCLAANQQERLKLRSEPVYLWTNPTRDGVQHGAVFVWTLKGRAAVVGCIFSHPAPDQQRVVNHEFHSLALEPLIAQRPSNRVAWSPAQPGIELKPIPGAPAPLASVPKHLAQLRTLAREFNAHSAGYGDQWDLRLLPQPLYRYESTDPAVLDGAVFGFVTSAGTDPEVLLVIEARQTDKGPQWYYAAARFSDLNLWVNHKDQEVWSFRNAEANPQFEAALKDRYRLFRDRMIPEITIARPREQSR